MGAAVPSCHTNHQRNVPWLGPSHVRHQRNTVYMTFPTNKSLVLDSKIRDIGLCTSFGTGTSETGFAKTQALNGHFQKTFVENGVKMSDFS